MTRPGFDHHDAARRVGLAVACACDASALVVELQAMAQRAFEHEGQPTMLAAKVLAKRVQALADGVYSALGEFGCNVGELQGQLYGVAADAQAANDPAQRGDLARALVNQAEGVQA